MHSALEGMAQDCFKTIEVKEKLSLTRAVLQTVNILPHWMSIAMATVQASLVFTPYLTLKSNKRETWAEPEPSPESRQ